MRKTAARWRARRKTDPLFLLKCRIKVRYACELRRKGLKPEKSYSDAIHFLGISLAEFAEYVESKFKPGMNWSNARQWQLDHIVPLSDFDMTDPALRRAAFHYSNIQPLWEDENRLKYAGEKGRRRKPI